MNIFLALALTLAPTATGVDNMHIQAQSNIIVSNMTISGAGGSLA